MKLAADDDGSILFAAGRMSASVKDLAQDLHASIMGGRKSGDLPLPGDAFNRMVVASREYDLRVQYGPRSFKPELPAFNTDPDANKPLELGAIVHELTDRELIAACGLLLGKNLPEKDMVGVKAVIAAWTSFGVMTHVHRKNVRRIIEKFQKKNTE